MSLRFKANSNHSVIRRNKSVQPKSNTNLTQTKAQQEAEVRVINLTSSLAVIVSVSYTHIDINSDVINITFTTNRNNTLFLHWGVFYNNYYSQWVSPLPMWHPKKTKSYDYMAVDTEFIPSDNTNTSIITITIQKTGIHSNIGGINFCFTDYRIQYWYNNNKRDYNLRFNIKYNKPKLMSIIQQQGIEVPQGVIDIIKSENSDQEWTLLKRYNKCFDIIKNSNSNEDKSADIYFWWLIYLYSIYSSQVNNQMNLHIEKAEIETSIKDLQLQWTSKFVYFYSNQKPFSTFTDILPSNIIRTSISLINDLYTTQVIIKQEIENIRSSIVFSDSPSTFYGQWYNKLSRSCDMDDVEICIAWVEFLKTGNINNYRRYLNKAWITEEKMNSYENQISIEPYYEPAYLDSFKHLLTVLQSCFKYNRVEYLYREVLSMDCCSEELKKDVSKYMANKDIELILKIRRECKRAIENRFTNWVQLNTLIKFEILIEKEFYLLLAGKFETTMSKSSKNSTTGLPELLTWTGYSIQNILFDYQGYSNISQCYRDFLDLTKNKSTEFDDTFKLKLKAIIFRLISINISYLNFVISSISSRAFFFGLKTNMNEFFINNISFYITHLSSFKSLSFLISKYDSFYTSYSNTMWSMWTSTWSNETIIGNIIYSEYLIQTQKMKFEKNTIILTKHISGNETIPQNCSLVIILNKDKEWKQDVYSRFTYQCISNKINCLECSDISWINQIMVIGHRVNISNSNWNKTSIAKVTISNSSIDCTIMKGNSDNSFLEITSKRSSVPIDEIMIQPKTLVIEPENYSRENVGDKSWSTFKMWNQLPGWIKYPKSISIHKKAWNYYWSLPVNAGISQNYTMLKNKIRTYNNYENINERYQIFQQFKEWIIALNIPKEDKWTIELSKKLIQFGIGKSDLPIAFDCIKRVWMSKFNEYEYNYLRENNANIFTTNISILIQEVIPADYSFVIYTKNINKKNYGSISQSEDNEEWFIEIKKGFSIGFNTTTEDKWSTCFSVVFNNKNKLWNVVSYPSIPYEVENNSKYIFRSDTEEFSTSFNKHRKLFTCCPMNKGSLKSICYSDCSWITDYKFCEGWITKISWLGIEIEHFYNSPQIIKGLYKAGNYYIVGIKALHI